MVERDAVAANLDFLCRGFPSITQLCGEIGINRQQFTKYLSGASRPSRTTQARIARYFGISETDLFLSPAVFARDFATRRDRWRRTPSEVFAQRLVAHARRSRGDLVPYVGWYHRYYFSFSRPSYVLRSLMRIDLRGEEIVTRAIERLVEPGNRAGRAAPLFKYDGVALVLRERIFILEIERLLENEVCETVLFPNYRSRVDILSGIITGVSAQTTREPMSSRVVLKSLGQTIDWRSALGRCGLLLFDDPDVPEDVRRLIRPSREDVSLLRGVPV